MYYQLKPKYGLRGWQRLPYGLLDLERKQVAMLAPEVFEPLRLAIHGIETESILLNDKDRENLKKLEQMGIIEAVQERPILSQEQEYKVYPSRLIRSAHWSVTGKCNYRCKHCYMSAPHAKCGELSHETCMEIVRQLAECGIQRVSLTGGEPLVRRDFLDIVDALLENKILITTIYSNGRLITPKFLDELEKRGIHPEINMSFDGVGWHDWLRGVEGAEEDVIRAFKLCKERGFPIGAELTLHKGNKDTLRESVNLLASLGVATLKVGPVIEVGEWVQNGDDMTLTDEETYEIYLDYLPHYIEDGQPLYLHLSSLFISGPDKKSFRVPGRKHVRPEKAHIHCLCGHARNSLYITAEGRWMPCMPMSGKDALAAQFPSVLDTPLHEALEDSFYMSCIEKRLDEYLEHNPQCQECEYKYDCASGCRGQAASEDDYLAIDKGACALFKGDYIPRLEKMMEEYGMKCLS